MASSCDGRWPRVRLEFNPSKLLKQKDRRAGLDRSWLSVPPSLVNIEQLTEHILGSFRIRDTCRHAIHLQMDGFSLPPTQPISLLRDGDVISVTICGEQKQMPGQLLLSGPPPLKDWSIVPFVGQEHVSDVENQETGKRKKAGPDVKKDARRQEQSSGKSRDEGGVSSKQKRKREHTSVEHKRKKHQVDQPSEAKKSTKSIERGASGGKVERAKEPPPPSSSDESEEEGKGKPLEPADGKEKKPPSRSARRKARKRIWLRMQREAGAVDQHGSASPASVGGGQGGRDTPGMGKGQDGREKGAKEGDGTELAMGESCAGSIKKGGGDRGGQRRLAVMMEVDNSGIKLLAKEKGGIGGDSTQKPLVIRKGHVRFEPADDDEKPIVRPPDPVLNIGVGVKSKRRGQAWGQAKEWEGHNGGWEGKKGRAHQDSEHLEIYGEANGGEAPSQPLTKKRATWVDFSVKAKVPTSLSYEELPPLIGFPTVGSVIAYRIVLLSLNSWTPELSSYREGRVSFVDVDQGTVRVEPPDDVAASISGRAAWLKRQDGGGERMEEEEEEKDEITALMEAPYSPNGVLETDFSALVDVRLVSAGPPSPSPEPTDSVPASASTPHPSPIQVPPLSTQDLVSCTRVATPLPQTQEAQEPQPVVPQSIAQEPQEVIAPSIAIEQSQISKEKNLPIISSNNMSNQTLIPPVASALSELVGATSAPTAEGGSTPVMTPARIPQGVGQIGGSVTAMVHGFREVGKPVTGSAHRVEEVDGSVTGTAHGVGQIGRSVAPVKASVQQALKQTTTTELLGKSSELRRVPPPPWQHWVGVTQALQKKRAELEAQKASAHSLLKVDEFRAIASPPPPTPQPAAAADDSSFSFPVVEGAAEALPLSVGAVAGDAEASLPGGEGGVSSADGRDNEVSNVGMQSSDQSHPGVEGKGRNGGSGSQLCEGMLDQSLVSSPILEEFAFESEVEECKKRMECGVGEASNETPIRETEPNGNGVRAASHASNGSGMHDVQEKVENVVVAVEKGPFSSGNGQKTVNKSAHGKGVKNERGGRRGKGRGGTGRSFALGPILARLQMEEGP